MKGLFKEYLTMAANGAKNFSNVVEGNFNLLKDRLNLLPQDQQDEADRRFSICNDCPFNSVNAVKNGWYETQRIDLHCSICSCPLEAKVLAFDDKCGMSNLSGWKIRWDVYKPKQ